ncbi:MAG TPA: DUF1854 domain-containing protein [Rhodocyclaceae bacterium]|nr:DUF1854 domain-containing protein [Rhodocyclaceae bacterium]
MQKSELQLGRNVFGRLVLVRDGAAEEVVPVRAFPISAADEGVALINAEGREVAWFDRMADVPETLRGLVESELASREFMPEIKRIESVSSFATPSTWQVETDRGHTAMVLKGEEDIRRLGRTSLLIADSNGIQFLVRDIEKLDRASRRMLDRFL